MNNQIKLFNGDCLEVMKDITDGSVDMICADPPYQITACAWDSIIPLEPMWAQLKRIIKANGAIVLTASQPFTTTLISSNMGMFKYEWIWDKKIPSGMSYAKFQPMRQHENVLVFCDGRTLYNAQKIRRIHPIKGGGMSKGETTNNQNLKALKRTYTHKNPTSILRFDKVRKDSTHPTQKPVALMEYLIKTYTNKGETVLDFCMGSGTTGIASKITNRKFIGIEKDADYFEIAKNRIENPEYKPPSKKEKQKGENKGLFPDDEIANLLTIKSH